ncbi:hypothetical protein MVES1_001289 [Malassezia vespertilionis]|uniref:Translin n=1 Tax=Malassezia vespertilionis TaxID=2020962 RepID=A0A2N1JEY1_9BASI|nr:uncharacterized protein MVES1_001289 [Malassezia vespertilionis]PKI85117.1 hypothetical protein MVES_001211 [Malassezia vespertilionis]WFD05953.1 hypothetical protein MVES1_001289 [Malassezia vespertilionis]
MDVRARLDTSFEAFRDEIDAANERRDRMLKVARDVTGLSKKVIFHLHRFRIADGWPFAGEEHNAGILQEAHGKLEHIYTILRACALDEGLAGPSDRPSVLMLRNERNIGGAIEELVEAVSFLYFLEHNALIPHGVVQDPLRSPTGTLLVYIAPMRYLLGLSDLTGELMRFGINAASAPAALFILAQVLGTQQQIYYALERLVPYYPAVGKKQQVSLASIHKVQDAAYAIRIRSAEYGHDKHLLEAFARRAAEPQTEEGACR